MELQYLNALKALADPHRLRLCWLLIHVDQKITVAEAMDVMGETQYNVSRNLKILFKAGLLDQEKHGKWVYYTLAEQTEAHWQLLVDSVRQLPASQFESVTGRCNLRLGMREAGECVVGPNSETWTKLIDTNE